MSRMLVLALLASLAISASGDALRSKGEGGELIEPFYRINATRPGNIDTAEPPTSDGEYVDAFTAAALGNATLDDFDLDEELEGDDEDGEGEAMVSAMSTNSNDWRRQLLRLVNDVRQRSGRARLCLNQKLNRAAVAHSQDQAARRQMSHSGSDGSTVATRITRQGYTWRGAGENVAWNFATPQAVFNAWMNSPGHRANILGDFRHLGLGRADGAGGRYWTQVFATPMYNNEACS